MASVNAFSSSKFLKSFDFTAAGSSTTTKNLGSTASQTGSWYFITATRISDGAEKIFKVSTSKTIIKPIINSLNSKLGEAINFDFNVKIVGSDLLFEVINFETSDVTFNYLRLRK